MEADGCAAPVALRVDGGMAANNWLCRFLAAITDCRVDRPSNLETTALGAAFLAGLATGVWRNLDEISQTWSAAQSFRPAMPTESRRSLVQGWRKALARTLSDL
jgi:glycerol kinase